MSLLRIGVSACFFHADPERKIFKGKTLLYMEQSMSQWIMRGGGLPVMLPSSAEQFTPEVLVGEVDALVLQGGSDMSPKHYGEEPVRPEWSGDYVRDLYEMALIKAAMAQNKPVLGVCRGLQVINVALGGSLYQDIETMHPKKKMHRNWELYDQLFHDVRVEKGSFLSGFYDARVGTVNSVHHQGIKQLGKGLVSEAVSTEDDLVEAIRYDGKPFVLGVQWHPEFQDPKNERLLSPNALIQAFMNEVRARRA